jgi:threonine dehydratase
MQPPTYADVLAARPRVYAHLQPSPLLHHPLLDEWVGCRVLVKHENHNPTGSFKIRGGLNLVGQLEDRERQRGVIAASTGNHGQSLALACQLHSVRCRIVVPMGANADKVAAIRAFGAEVVEHGRDFDEAREWVEEFAARDGWRYVHSANEPHLIAGVATYAAEVFEAVERVDYVFVPIGGGSGAAGCALVREGLRTKTRIVGVQAVEADAFTRSWRGPVRVTRERAETFAEGIATRTTFDLTFSMLKAALDDVVTLEEQEIRDGIAAAIQFTHNLAEGAGAAPLAAARKFTPRKDATVVCVMSGGNAEMRAFPRPLARMARELRRDSPNRRGEGGGHTLA